MSKFAIGEKVDVPIAGPTRSAHSSESSRNRFAYRDLVKHANVRDD
jgi:hypothetical protein